MLRTALGTLSAVLSTSAWAGEGTLSTVLPADATIPDASSLQVNPTLEKRDVLIAGHKVVIDAPIFSNGGDVLVLADELIIAAPIDTRVRHKPLRFWQAVQPQSGWLSLDWITEGRPASRDSVGSFYLWDEYWDESSRKYRYRVRTLDEFSSANAQGLAAMPSGAMAGAHIGSLYRDQDRSPTDGADAPKPDRLFFKSGTIRIFARSISFCNDCKSFSGKETKVTDGDPFDRERTRYLVTSGLKGSRAGLGTLFPCVYNYQGGTPGGLNRVPCESPERANPTLDNRLGGVSGWPGKAGDAGDIVITFVGNPAAARRERQALEEVGPCGFESACPDFADRLGRSIAALAEANGGAPSHIHKLQTPSEATLRSVPKGTRAIFPEIGQPSPDFFELSGENGEIVIRNVRPDQAIGELAPILTAIDTKEHNLRKAAGLIDQGTLSLQPASLMARDILSDFLSATLERRQKNLIGVTLIWEGKDPLNSLPSDLFTGMDCRSPWFRRLSPNEQDIGRRICELDLAKGYDPVASYLLRTGGLLRLPTNIAGVEPQLQLAVAKLSSLEQSLVALRADVAAVDTRLFEMMTAAERNAYVERLKALQHAVDQAIARMNAVTSKSSRLLVAFTSAQKSIGTVLAAVTAQDYISAGAALPKAVGDVGSAINVLLAANYSADERTLVQKAEQQLGAAVSEYAAFLERTDAERMSLLQRRDTILWTFITAKRDYAKLRRTFQIDFETLYKYAIINRIGDTNPSGTSLSQALNTLDDAVTRWPRGDLSAFPRSPRDYCAGQASIPLLETVPATSAITCVSVPSETKPTLQLGLFGPAKRIVPLLTLPEGNASYPVNYFGFFSRQKIRTQVLDTEDLP